MRKKQKPALAIVVSDFGSFVANELLEMERIGYHLLVLVNNYSSKVRDSIYEYGLSGFDFHAYVAVKEKGFLPYVLDLLKSNGLELVRSPIGYFAAYKESARYLGVKKFLRVISFASKIRSRQVSHIHAQFAQENAEVARVLALYLGKPYSFTAHANDIFVQKQNLSEKIQSASFVRTISEFNKSYLVKSFPLAAPRKVKVIHCGVDVPAQGAWLSDDSDQYIVGTVGRFVEKKGFSYLLEALRILVQRGEKVFCEIVGDGPLRSELLRSADGMHSVEFMGALANDEVIGLLKNCHCFILPCVQASDGDLDGIPVSIMEAMALGLPVVSTKLSGIPELVEDGVSGILVQEKDSVALADAIQWMAKNPEKAKRMGMAGREKILESFSLRNVVNELVEEIERHYG